MRFRLRTLILLVVLASLLFAWTGVSYRLVQARRPYFSRFNDHDYPLRSVTLFPPEHSQIPWIRRMMGDCAEPTLLYSPKSDPSGEEYRRVRELFPETTIWGWPGSREPLPKGVNRLPNDTYFVI